MPEKTLSTSDLASMGFVPISVQELNRLVAIEAAAKHFLFTAQDLIRRRAGDEAHFHNLFYMTCADEFVAGMMAGAMNELAGATGTQKIEERVKLPPSERSSK